MDPEHTPSPDDKARIQELQHQVDAVTRDSQAQLAALKAQYAAQSQVSAHPQPQSESGSGGGLGNGIGAHKGAGQYRTNRDGEHPQAIHDREQKELLEKELAEQQRQQQMNDGKPLTPEQIAQIHTVMLQKQQQQIALQQQLDQQHQPTNGPSHDSSSSSGADYEQVRKLEEKIKLLTQELEKEKAGQHEGGDQTHEEQTGAHGHQKEGDHDQAHNEEEISNLQQQIDEAKKAQADPSNPSPEEAAKIHDLEAKLQQAKDQQQSAGSSGGDRIAELEKQLAASRKLLEEAEVPLQQKIDDLQQQLAAAEAAPTDPDDPSAKDLGIADLKTKLSQAENELQAAKTAAGTTPPDELGRLKKNLENISGI